MTLRWWFHRFGIFAPQNMKIVSTNTPVFQMYLVRIGVKGPPNIGAFRRSKDRLTWKTKAYPHRHLVDFTPAQPFELPLTARNSPDSFWRVPGGCVYTPGKQGCDDFVKATGAKNSAPSRSDYSVAIIPRHFSRVSRGLLSILRVRTPIMDVYNPFQGSAGKALASIPRWAPTSYKWSYNPYKWPCKWVTGVITL